MNNRFHKTICVATLVVLLLFPLQQMTHLFPLSPLSGAYSKQVFPSLSWRDVVSGSWQNAFDAYNKQSFGFHEWAVRLYNQYQWSLFRHTSVKDVAIGREGYLYERYFVEEYYESRMYKYTDSPEELLSMFRLQAERLGKVQAILEQCGVYLFVMTPAGKEVIYPEYLPARDTLTRPKGPTAVGSYPVLFDRYGVRFLNMSDWMLRLKDSVAYQVIPQCGTHWSNICSTYAFDSIMHYMERISGLDITDVSLSEPYYDNPRKPDHDLSDLLNLLRPLPAKADMYVGVTLGPIKARPRLVVIGDSFFWNIIYSFPLEKLFDWHYWYYNSTHFAYGQNGRVADLDLVGELMGSDFVMLSYCTGQLYDLGNGFVEHALIHLCYDDAQIEQTLQGIMASMRADKAWRASLQEKALQQGSPLDEVMRKDAEYLIYSAPEDFFPELRGSELPQVRNSRVLLKQQSL